MKHESFPPTERLAGIEWMRGIAAFGVICIHSGLAVHNDTTRGAGDVREDFGFVVPFFLVVSFFFAVRSERSGWMPWGEWMRRRAARLLVPFVFWSAVYLALHIAKLMVRHQSDQVEGLFGDPAALVLSGGTSVALYFLPLLFTGLVLIHALSGFFRKSPAYLFVIGLVVSLGVHEMCLRNGYDYAMGSTDSGPAVVKLLLGLIEEGVRCSPLVFIAGLLNLYLPSPGLRNAWPLIGGGFLLMISVWFVAMLTTLVEPARGLGAFLLAWGLSGLLAPNKVATTVGLFSFGVYLIHQVFLELIQVALPPMPHPIGVIGTFAICSLVYLTSMLAVGLANHGHPLVKRIFGLR